MKLVDALHCIHTATLCSKQNIAKQRFINKSLEQFASVSFVSIPDSCTFYRDIINQTGLVAEKEGHNMEISPLDLLMCNGGKKKGPRKGFLYVGGVGLCVCARSCTHG